jgi:hypothetical protein
VTARETVPLSAFLRPELPDAALHGLPGEVTRRLAAGSEADPAAPLLTFLTMFGNAAGPQPHAVFGAAQPSRLFLLVVGDAASGRKGTAHQAVDAVRRGGPALVGEPDLRRAPVGRGDGRAGGGPASDDCRLLVLETEFDRMIETMARTGALAAQLRNAFDGRVLAVTRRDRGTAGRLPLLTRCSARAVCGLDSQHHRLRDRIKDATYNSPTMVLAPGDMLRQARS